MYEIFGIAIGWNLSSASDEVKEIVSECLEHVGGQQPYSGSGEASTYIGEDLYDLDCGSVMEGLTLDEFNAEITKALKSSKVKLAKDIPAWRKKIREALDEFATGEEPTITEEDVSEVMELVKAKPTVFFTWSTS